MRSTSCDFLLLIIYLYGELNKTCNNNNQIYLIVPCTRQLAETRDNQANQAEHLITEDHQAAGEVVESDSVLTQFSSVVTDTQEYMSPHSSQDEAAVIPVEHDNRTDEVSTSVIR